MLERKAFINGYLDLVIQISKIIDDLKKDKPTKARI